MPTSETATLAAVETTSLPEVTDAPDQPQLSDAEAAALDAFQPAAEGTPDQPCNLTGMLATALAQSSEVQQGLAELPTEQRSVANAIDLWDGQWPEDSSSGGKGLLRALLVKAVTAARPDCLTVANHGPALFLIPDSHTTVVLAVGSGDWRWGDLITPSDPLQPVAADYFAGLASR